MTDHISNKDFCLICGSLLPSKEDVTCYTCDEYVMDIMANGAKMRRQKSVVQLSGGSVVDRFPSISDASRKTGVAISSISRVCAGDMKKAGGFAWSYS